MKKRPMFGKKKAAPKKGPRSIAEGLEEAREEAAEKGAPKKGKIDKETGRDDDGELDVVRRGGKR